jgi:hypothetical protein
MKTIIIEYMAIDKNGNRTYFHADKMPDAIQWVENHLNLSNEPYTVYLSTREGAGNALVINY